MPKCAIILIYNFESGFGKMGADAGRRGQMPGHRADRRLRRDALLAVRLRRVGIGRVLSRGPGGRGSMRAVRMLRGRRRAVSIGLSADQLPRRAVTFLDRKYTPFRLKLDSVEINSVLLFIAFV